MFQLVLEVLGADVIKHFILALRAFQLVQLHIIEQADAALLGLLEFVLIQLQELHTAPDGGSGKAGLFRDVLDGIAHVKHHLEALRLLVDRQIGPLHILREHRTQLLPLRHLDHDAGELFQTGQLCGRKTAVADDDAVAFSVPLLCDFPDQRNNGEVLEYAVDLNALGQLGHIAQVLTGVIGMPPQFTDRNVLDFCHKTLLSYAELCPSAGTVYYFRLMPFTRHQCRWACFFLAVRQAAQKRFSLRS